MDTTFFFMGHGLWFWSDHHWWGSQSTIVISPFWCAIRIKQVIIWFKYVVCSARFLDDDPSRGLFTRVPHKLLDYFITSTLIFCLYPYDDFWTVIPCLSEITPLPTRPIREMQFHLPESLYSWTELNSHFVCYVADVQVELPVFFLRLASNITISCW
jgi:hypothetical protein